MKNVLYIFFFSAILFLYINNSNLPKYYYLNSNINYYEIKNNHNTIVIQKRNSKSKLIFSIKLIYNDGEYYWVTNGYNKVLALTSKKARSSNVHKSKYGIRYKTFSRKLYPHNIYYTFFEPYYFAIIYDSLYNIKEIEEQNLSNYKEKEGCIIKYDNFE